MADRSHSEMVDLFSRAVPHDLDTLRQVCHADFVSEFPQSRERFRERFEGVEAVYEANREYITSAPEDRDIQRIRGAEDKWVVTPSFTATRISGTGDEYTVEPRSCYADDSIWNIVTIVEFRDDKISKATHYFAAPFDPPEKRANWAKRMAD